MRIPGWLTALLVLAIAVPLADLGLDLYCGRLYFPVVCYQAVSAMYPACMLMILRQFRDR